MPAKTERKMRKIEGDFVILEPGDKIEGVLTKKDSIIFKRGTPQESTVGKYTLVDEDTERQTSFLGATKIDQLLDDIQEGTYIRVTRNNDLKTSSGNKLKDYSLEVEE